MLSEAATLCEIVHTATEYSESDGESLPSDTLTAESRDVVRETLETVAKEGTAAVRTAAIRMLEDAASTHEDTFSWSRQDVKARLDKELFLIQKVKDIFNVGTPGNDKWTKAITKLPMIHSSDNNNAKQDIYLNSSSLETK